MVEGCGRARGGSAMLSRVENGSSGTTQVAGRGRENSATSQRKRRSGPAARRNYRGRGAFICARLGCLAAIAHGYFFRGAALATAASLGGRPAVWLHPALSISVATAAAEVAGGASGSRESTRMLLGAAKIRDGSRRGGLGWDTASTAATNAVFDR